VAYATGSGLLTGSIELGAVWAAIPDLMPPAPQLPLDDSWRRALRAYEGEWAHAPYPLVTRGPLELLIDGLAEDGAVGTLRTELADYPTAHGAGVMQMGDPGDPQSAPVYAMSPAGYVLPRVMWRKPPPESGEPMRSLDDIAPRYRRTGVRALVPRLAGRDFLSPLMLWWVLLFGLSMVARYDPELWVDALNVKQSEAAVPIEVALEAAIEAVPELVLEALLASQAASD
jgi:hypothetical protein